ncbi:MAG: cysteine desulfurase [Planctomycetes bacterium]|nr:cysteine desulfurase [Planctomycetota bacterium]
MPSELPIYLDHHATTPVDPRVLQAMLPYFYEQFGNASSLHHAYGQAARAAVARAREQVADLLNVTPRDVIFTSGATEANNLAIKGTLAAAPAGSHLIVNAAEHKSVLDVAHRLGRHGVDVTVLPVNSIGCVDPESVSRAIHDKTVLVSAMTGNNEVGSINPIHQIADICAARNVTLHSDMTQALGRIPVDLATLPVDFVSVSAHKIYGPKGVGALIKRRSTRNLPLEPQLDGGGHEHHLRSGTLAVPLIVGFGRACELIRANRESEAQRLRELTDRLEQGLISQLPDVTVNGPPLSRDRLPGNLNLSFGGVDGDALLVRLKRIAVSSGAACSTADPEPSHVLRAMGVPDKLVKASLRFGLGHPTTLGDIAIAIDEVVSVVRELRSLSQKPPATATCSPHNEQ